MKWVSVQDRKPENDGYYFWKGKGHYGGKSYFDCGENAFNFPLSVPANKVDPEYLEWLDESEDDIKVCMSCEKTVNYSDGVFCCGECYSAI
jgi:hypothetical protein